MKALLLLATLSLPFQPVATLVGSPSVRDGDGLLFGDIEVRLQGIAAPEDGGEKSEPGGSAATEALVDLVDGKEVTCYLDGTTAGKAKRPVGICFVGGIEINETLIKKGVARDCPAYSGGRYSGAEAAARNKGFDLSLTYPLPDYC